MPRSDLLVSLVRTATRGDQVGFTKTLEAVIADERRKQHHVLADRLAEYATNGMASGAKGSPVSRNGTTDQRLEGLFVEKLPRKTLDDLLLPAIVHSACNELVEEQHRRDLLHSYGLAPRNRVLLLGPPGNGKTSIAEALASALSVPLVSVRYEGIIGSYLGETATRLRQLFDYVRTRECVLFFDEFDTIGKERGDTHETGEIKRVVSSLLLQVDSLPSYVVAVAATNHGELLDRAVWRRFQLRLELPKPSRSQVEEWFRRFSAEFPTELGISPRTLADKLHGVSFAEIEEFGTDLLRRYVLGLPGQDVKEIIRTRLEQWKYRNLAHSHAESSSDA
jgi:SpoVK/Ycf46/Vps4 family AAA+-type ATPase